MRTTLATSPGLGTSVRTTADPDMPVGGSRRGRPVAEVAGEIVTSIRFLFAGPRLQRGEDSAAFGAQPNHIVRIDRSAVDDVHRRQLCGNGQPRRLLHKRGLAGGQ